MAIPKIDVPTYKTKLHSTGKSVTFRPFLVKEEKILLLALSTDNENDFERAAKQILQNCILDDIDVEKLPVYDVQYLFLQIRIKSVGEVSSIQFSGLENTECDECKKAKNVDLDLREIKVQSNEDHSNKVQLTEDVGLILKEPTLNALLDNLSSKDVDKVFDLVISCIESVYDDAQQYPALGTPKEELVELLESLNKDQFQKIEKFFDTMPKLQHKINWECSSCGKKESYTLEGLDSFFG